MNSYANINVSEEHNVSIFRDKDGRALEKHTVPTLSPKDGDGMFLRNIGIYLQIHTASLSQINNIAIYTAVRTPKLTYLITCFVKLVNYIAKESPVLYLMQDFASQLAQEAVYLSMISSVRRILSRKTNTSDRYNPHAVINVLIRC